ncbi:MAG: hypothetical protein MAG453_01441 [Calditrichaeota bacterium]|nr:hypothetical protein [Calditrichota bacterium]
MFEIEVARTLGNTSYANSLVLFNDTFYPDQLTDGFIFSVTPGYEGGEFQGSFYIGRFMNDTSYELAGWVYSPVINNGLEAYNTLSVACEGNSLTFYINGHEVYTYYEEMVPLSGYVGVAATEQGGTFPDYAVVNWDYVAYDNAGGAMQPGRSDPPALPDLSAILPEHAMRAPDEPQQVDRATEPPVATVNGGFFDENTGMRELDGFINYRIYRNGEFAGTSDTESYTETLPDFGRYDYLVTADYDEGESEPDSAQAVYRDPAGIVIDEDFNDGFPDGWTIDWTVEEHTWHIDEGDELALFDTPYMLVNDEASMGADLDERLQTPSFNVEGAELVIVEFDTWFHQFDFEFGHIQYQADGGEWTSVYLYHNNRPDTTHARWDLTDEPAGAETARIGFRYDDFMDFDGLYWGIDNVEVYVQGAGETDPVTLTLMPQNTTIPAGGGSLIYDGHLVNTTADTYPGVRYWNVVTAPDGDEIGPLQVFPFTIEPFMDVMVEDPSLNVPAGAPAGEYTFTGYVGYVNGPNVSDSFAFTKEGAVAGSSEWSAGGSWIAGDREPAAATVPGEFALAGAYPNPFNPETKLAVSLPEAAELTVTVYNVRGRQVASLASGRYRAGTHEFVFDGSALASGLYFVRVSVPGELDAVKKVTLLR